MILRLLRPQGVAGLVAALCLALLLMLQKSETRHWRQQSGAFERRYRQEQAAFAATVANYRAAAAAARIADQANAARAAAARAIINERTAHAFDQRIFAARAAAARAADARLRSATEAAAADPRAGRAARLPAISAAARDSAQAAGEDGLPAADGLIATEQAIQLDELIKWVRAQSSLSVGGNGPKP